MREGSPTHPARRLRPARLVRALAAAAVAFGVFAAAGTAAADPSVPDGFTLVVTDGIDVTGYYDTTVRTAYVRSTASDWSRMHERCHAHQHLTILLETGQEPAGLRWQLDPWYTTSEGAGYIEAVARSAYRWPPGWLSDDNPLEDFANACGLYFLNPGWLYSLDPIRYHAVDALFAPPGLG